MTLQRSSFSISHLIIRISLQPSPQSSHSLPRTAAAAVCVCSLHFSQSPFSDRFAFAARCGSALLCTPRQPRPFHFYRTYTYAHWGRLAGFGQPTHIHTFLLARSIAFPAHSHTHTHTDTLSQWRRTTKRRPSAVLCVCVPPLSSFACFAAIRNGCLPLLLLLSYHFFFFFAFSTSSYFFYILIYIFLPFQKLTTKN